MYSYMYGNTKLFVFKTSFTNTIYCPKIHLNIIILRIYLLNDDFYKRSAPQNSVLMPMFPNQGYIFGTSP
jgi:hypothetical protein